MSRPDDIAPAPLSVVRRIVELSLRAPSVHNSQPWHWRYVDGVLELHADRSRQLLAGDPLGRNLLISCGAALQHVDAAATAMGWRATVDRLPDGPHSGVLARLRLAPGTPPRRARETLDAIDRRYTDRRRFTAWPVPDEQLGHLASVATQWGSHGVALADVTERFRVELLVARALERQSADRSAANEQRHWIDHGPTDGVPAAVLPGPHQLQVRRPNRFSVGVVEDSDQEVESRDGLILLCGDTDAPSSWLRAGEGLSALWLAATVDGLSVVPLSQVIEVEETRAALQHEVLGGLASPLLLMRVGWQAISRGDLPRTPRRTLDTVLSLT